MNMRAFSLGSSARSFSSRTCSHVSRASLSRSAPVPARPPSSAVVSAQRKSFSSSSPRLRPSRQSQEPKAFTRYTLPTQIRIDRASDMTVDKRPRKAYIALGSNLGDRIAEIERACRKMDARGITVKRTSSLWETEPMYVTDQDRFVNGACEVGQSHLNLSSSLWPIDLHGTQVETTLEPLDLLDQLQDIENSMGRKKMIDKGPRNIDLDILLYEDEVVHHDRLKIPHVGIPEREFVLRPLAE